MEKFSLKQLMLALGCMSGLFSVILIKPTERITTEQKEADSTRAKGSKRPMSVVFTEPENSKKAHPEAMTSQLAPAPWAQMATQKGTGSKPQKAGSRKPVVSLLPENAKKARQEDVRAQLASAPRAQSGSIQRKAGLRTVTRSRRVPLNTKKARQEIEAVAPQQKAIAPQSNVAPTDAADVQQQLELASDMLRNMSLAATVKARSNAQNHGELALTQTILQSTILNTEKARLAHEQKNAEAEEAHAQTLAYAETIEHLNKKILEDAKTIKAARSYARTAINALGKIPGTEPIIARLQHKERMHRLARLDEENSR